MSRSDILQAVDNLRRRLVLNNRSGGRSGALAALCAGLVLVTGACDNPPLHGVVTSMSGQPGHYHDWVSYGHTCVAYSKTGGCNAWQPHVTAHHDYIAEWWQVCIHRDAGDTQHDETGCFNLPHEQWVRYHVGSHYPSDQ